MTLEERAVKAKGWRWLPGMRSSEEWDNPADIDYCGPAFGRIMDDGTIESDSGDVGRSDPNTDCLPDFTDPATLGCLLALVRDAWGDPLLYAESWDRSPGNPGWVIQLLNETIAKGDTEAACLIAALESAP